jgi:predicted AAA+ superfamily ATPase
MSNSRWLEAPLKRELARPYVHILFGARQTGKSTLLARLVPKPALALDLSNPAERSRYLARPELLVQECLALPKRSEPSIVLVDEAQAVPALFDAVQHLYDRYRKRFRFILSGSSARKLRLTGANLLPGRALIHHLYPLTMTERWPNSGRPVCHVLELPGKISLPRFRAADLVERLTFGELPGVARAPRRDREGLLRSYAYVYLEEELRREALIKDWSRFSKFLRLAAVEAGQVVNLSRVANQSGVSVPTVKSHYGLLEDMFVGVPIEAYSGSPRKHVLSTPKFLFFDLGVRNAAAGLPLSFDAVNANPGPLFEQWVGIELWKRLKYLGRGKLCYFRTKSGAEVDYIIDFDDHIIPIEVKWTDDPQRDDARHLITLVSELGTRAPQGYIVCRCERPRQIADKIMAVPWQAV